MNGWSPEVPQGVVQEIPPTEERGGAQEIAQKANAVLTGVFIAGLIGAGFLAARTNIPEKIIDSLMVGHQSTEQITESTGAGKAARELASPAGEKLKGGTGHLGRAAVGAETERERDRKIISQNIKNMFQGQHPAAQLLTYFIGVGGYEDDITKPKNMNIVSDPKLYNSRMQLVVKLLDEEIKKRKIEASQVAEALNKVGHPSQASQLWEDVYLSNLTGQPLSSEKLAEIKEFFEREERIPWTD